MEHMNRKYKKEDAMLRPHVDSTFDKALKKRQEKKAPTELDDSNILNRKSNERMKRKQALMDAMNKVHDTDIVG
jgi:hypothetical protein